MKKKSMAVLARYVTNCIIICVIASVLTGCEVVPGGKSKLEPVSQEQAITELSSYDTIEIISHDTDLNNYIDTFTYKGYKYYPYMTQETTGTIAFLFSTENNEWQRYEADTEITHKEEIWDVSGEWEYSGFSERVFVNPSTTIYFKLTINSFDGKTLEGSYYYYKKYVSEESEEKSGIINGSNHSNPFTNLNAFAVFMTDILGTHYFIIDKNDGVMVSGVDSAKYGLSYATRIDTDSHYVQDYANVLLDETKQKIISSNNGENGLEVTCNGAQIVIVTVDDLQGMTTDEYALNLFNSLGIGDRDRNNGMLLVLYPTEARGWLMPGVGITDYWTDARCEEYLDKYFWPLVDMGEYDMAVNSMFDHLLEGFKDYYGVL